MNFASHKRAAWVLSITGVLFFSSPLPLNAADPPSITAPSGYRAGDTATLTGQNFKASSPVWLEIVDPSGGISTLNIRTNNKGEFKKGVSLPQAGEYVIKVYKKNSNNEISSIIIKAANAN